MFYQIIKTKNLGLSSFLIIVGVEIRHVIGLWVSLLLSLVWQSITFRRSWVSMKTFNHIASKKTKRKNIEKKKRAPSNTNKSKVIYIYSSHTIYSN